MINKWSLNLIFLLIYQPVLAQSPIGSYTQIQTTSFEEDRKPFRVYQDNFDKQLFINKDSTFFYRHGLITYVGSWLQKANRVYFLKPKKPPMDRCYGLVLKGVRMSNDSSIKKIKTLTIFDVSNKDTTLFVGAAVQTKRGTQILGINEPIILDQSDSEINIEFLSFKLKYHFENFNKANAFSIYLCWGENTEHLQLKEPPFNYLILKENKLFDLSSKVVFKKVL